MRLKLVAQLPSVGTHRWSRRWSKLSLFLVDTITYTTTVTGNAWTVSVPVANIANFEAIEVVTANVSDLAGNPAPQAARNRPPSDKTPPRST